MIYISAFLCGGFLCVIAQILINKTKLTPARILVSYVVVGVVLSATGIYKHLVDIAGCGATVPLTGFGHVLAQGVEKAVNENGPVGILMGGLSGASSGIAAVIVFSLLASIFFKSKRQ